MRRLIRPIAAATCQEEGSLVVAGCRAYDSYLQ